MCAFLSGFCTTEVQTQQKCKTSASQVQTTICKQNRVLILLSINFMKIKVTLTVHYVKVMQSTLWNGKETLENEGGCKRITWMKNKDISCIHATHLQSHKKIMCISERFCTSQVQTTICKQNCVLILLSINYMKIKVTLTVL